MSSTWCTLKWSNHSNHVNRFLCGFYAEGKYTDVALACDGQLLKAHKIILASSSSYFENLFSKCCAPNLCIAIESVAYPILQLVLEFMYSGKITVKYSDLDDLMRAGRHLKVEGLKSIQISDLQTGAERTIVIARPIDDNQNLQSVMGTRPATHSPESPPKIPFDAVHIPRASLVEPQNSLTSPVNEDAVEPTLEPDTVGTSEDAKTLVMDFGQLNIASDEPADEPPATNQVTTTRSRIRKKPARILDTEFNYEPAAPKVKKRRTRKIASDEPADEPPATNQVTTTRSRIRKKPARILDTEFNFEPAAPKVKKRRTQKIASDEPADEPPATNQVTTTQLRIRKKPARIVDTEFNFEPAAPKVKKRRTLKIRKVLGRFDGTYQRLNYSENL